MKPLRKESAFTFACLAAAGGYHHGELITDRPEVGDIVIYPRDFPPRTGIAAWLERKGLLPKQPQFMELARILGFSDNDQVCMKTLSGHFRDDWRILREAYDSRN